MAKALIVLLLVGVVGVAAYIYMGSDPPKVAPHPGPPPGARFVQDPPEAIIGAVGAAKRSQKAAALDSFVGLWAPAEGWEGIVEEITQEREGPALRLCRITSRMIGGECWIVALVDDHHGASKGQTVHIQGKIRDVRILVGAATVSNSIVLEQARVVSRP